MYAIYKTDKGLANSLFIDKDGRSFISSNKVQLISYMNSLPYNRLLVDQYFGPRYLSNLTMQIVYLCALNCHDGESTVIAFTEEQFLLVSEKADFRINYSDPITIYLPDDLDLEGANFPMYDPSIDDDFEDEEDYSQLSLDF